MKKYHKADVLFVTLCFLAVNVQSLNYGYPVPRSSYQTSPLASVPSPAFGPLSPNSGTKGTINAEAQRKPNKSGTSYAIIYPLTFPQNRGGKNLNVTLVSESPQEQARILNQPDLYPNFAVRRQDFNKVSPINPSSTPQQYNDDKGTPLISKSAPTNSENPPFNNDPPENLGNKDKDSVFQLERNSKPDVSNKNFRQPKAVGYSVPSQINKSSYVSSTFDAQKNYRNTNPTYKVPSQLYPKVTIDGYNIPPPQQDTTENWPCFCVPYYLCKNGVINSGGRSVAAIRRNTRSTYTRREDTYNFPNKTYSPPLVQPKVMNAYVIEQESDPQQCERNKVCCRLSFSTDEKDNIDNYYPVATPRPEPVYPFPARFPAKPKDKEICGIRRAYGIQGRLKQLQYSADVSEFGEYPWQAAVLRKVEGQKSLYLCGGVLVSSLWVATAAHCLKKEQFSPLIIRLGEWDVNRKDEVYPYIELDVDSMILYPDFNPDTLYNDIGLIRMKIPVDTRLPHVTPACLPKRGTVYEQQKCWVSGWGKDFFGPQGEYQNVLKEVDVPVVARELCNTELRNTNLGPNFTLHPGFLCAGGEAGKDACTGDGGSPLVCVSGQTWYVIGLVSWGIGCGQPGVPGIYVNMLYYIDWINSIIWR